MQININSKIKTLSLISLTCAVAIGLSGCAKRQQDITGSVEVNPDYRERHPIILAETPRVLEIYASSGAKQLDFRQDQDIRSFASEYKSSGRGAVVASVPNGKPSTGALASVKRSLAAAGISGHYVKVTSYTPLDLESASPIRLSFLKLQASVDSLCGQWKTDITGAGTSERFTNASPSNFGCAYQSAFAAQVAYPIDLVRPRQEGAIDLEKRNQNILSIRSSKDPSTKYDTNASALGATK